VSGVPHFSIPPRIAQGYLVLDSDAAIAILDSAVRKAKNLNLPWREEPVVLQPSDELVKLVVKSQILTAQQGGDSGEGGD
jgi:hypothetical protein